MTADTLGGVWTYAVELGHALATRGVEVQVATMGRAMDDTQRDEARVFAAVHESTYPLEWQDQPWRGVDAAGRWLLAVASDVRPDVVHLNGYAHAALPWRAPTLVAAHSDVLSWWRAVHADVAPAQWHEYRRRVSAGLRAAGRVVAPTRAAAQDLQRSFGPRAVQVVPNCRRSELLDAGRAKEPFVLASGRTWDAAKGLDALCRVAPSLRARVAVAGEGEPDLPGVDVLGRLPFPELAAQMARAAVYAAPARYEPFGLGVLEAGLAGCALVLGDVPSLREVWGDAAAFVRDDAGLSAALAALVGDPALAAEHGAAARRAASAYNPQRTAEGYLLQYASLVGAR